MCVLGADDWLNALQRALWKSGNRGSLRGATRISGLTRLNCKTVWFGRIVDRSSDSLSGVQCLSCLALSVSVSLRPSERSTQKLEISSVCLIWMDACAGEKCRKTRWLFSWSVLRLIEHLRRLKTKSASREEFKSKVKSTTKASTFQTGRLLSQAVAGIKPGFDDQSIDDDENEVIVCWQINIRSSGLCSCVREMRRRRKKRGRTTKKEG